MTEELTCRNCKKLKLYKDCIGKEWYSYDDIWFCEPQMVWLIEHIGELGEQKWPQNPLDTEHIELPISKRRMPHEANFIKPSTVLAELMWRLGRTGKDGETLMHEILNLHVTSYELLNKHAQSALNYITGWWQKETTYSVWRAKRKYKKSELERIRVTR